MMGKLTFFDCNCSIGRIGYPHLLDISDVSGLRREMTIAGIEEALVYHTVAREGHPPLGNLLLLDEIKNSPELRPVWVLLPHHSQETSRPEILMKDMKENNVKAARLYPTRNYHSFSVSEWCSGELLTALEQCLVPLVLDIEIVTWEEVHNILKDHPHLPLIISNCSYRHNRFLYPLWERYENLYVETSRFMGAGTIADVCKRFGARRLLFGTNMPQYTGTAAVSLLTYSDLDEKEKQAIAGINLRGILKEMWP